MEETQKITETNYKDKYIEKLEEQNKILLESIQRKDKLNIYLIAFIVFLQCLVFSLGVYGYFYSPYLSYNDNSTTVSNNNLNNSDINE